MLGNKMAVQVIKKLEDTHKEEFEELKTEGEE